MSIHWIARGEQVKYSADARTSGRVVRMLQMDDYERDYDKRQLGWMAYFIEQFQRDTLSLGELVGKLEGLLAVLRDVDPAWEEAFVSAWGQLEIVYSFAVVYGSITLSDADTATVSEAVETLARLVKTKLDTLQTDADQ
jgi:hypothetical protein